MVVSSPQSWRYTSSNAWRKIKCLLQTAWKLWVWEMFQSRCWPSSWV